MNILSVLRTLGLAAVAASMAPVSAEEVHFKFGWAPGFKVRVDHQFSTEDRGKSKHSAVKYLLTVEEAGENLAVKFVNPTLGGPKLAPSAGVQAFQEHISAVAFPELRVNKSGEYLGLADPGAQTTRVLTLLQKVVAEKVPGPAQIGVNNSLLMFASPQFLDRKAEDLWNPIVGFWGDATVAVGERHEFETDVPVPSLPELTVRQKGYITLVETHTCLRGGVERTCAGIQMHAETDPEDAARVIKDMMERANTTRSPVPKIERLSSVSEMVLVTEPDGLFPHEYSLRREMQFSMTVNGKTADSRRVDTYEVRYSY